MVFGVDADIEINPRSTSSARRSGHPRRDLHGVVRKGQEAPRRRLEAHPEVVGAPLDRLLFADYFWWADHHAMNTSLVLMSIGRAVSCSSYSTWFEGKKSSFQA